MVEELEGKGGIRVVVREGWGEVMVVVKVIDLDMLKQLSVQEKKFVQQNSRHHKTLMLTDGHR